MQKSLTQFSESEGVDSNEKLELLKTIKLTRNLRDLGNQLPKPKYENIVDKFVKNNENTEKQKEVQAKEENKFSERLLVAQILQDNMQKNYQNQIVYKNDKPKLDNIKKDCQPNPGVNKLPPQIPKAGVVENNNKKLPLINNQKNQVQDYERDYFKKIDKHHLDYLEKMRLPPCLRYRSSSQRRREVNLSIDHKPEAQPVQNLKTPQNKPRLKRISSANHCRNQSNNSSQDNCQQNIQPQTPQNQNKIQQYLALLQQQKQLEECNQQKRRVSLGKQILQNNL